MERVNFDICSCQLEKEKREKEKEKEKRRRKKREKEERKGKGIQFLYCSIPPAHTYVNVKALKLTCPLPLYPHKFTDGESNKVIEAKQFSCRRTRGSSSGGSSTAAVAKLLPPTAVTLF
jgi:hypothetical protein